jgi:hypothetical protein
MFAWVTLPDWWTVSSTMRPVFGSKTGAGLPTVSVPLSAMRLTGLQVQPPSVDLREMTSMSPLSAELFLRPSANATRVPRELTRAGMRTVL